jgi:protein JSN1
MPNGQTVRIGFGKAESAPVAPAKGSPVTSPGATSPGGPASKTLGANPGLGGMDAQLQSSPTRALWIGSIPSTTTPATILSVFSPYGPIESARVLTHKNCGFSEYMTGFYYIHPRIPIFQSTLSVWTMPSEPGKLSMVVMYWAAM